jgi:sugar/nucleoside kinase (ribokinase family)
VSALICGSIAFDSVMVFQGRFRDHILPDRIHLLNVSFLVPSLRRNYGGCAGNIAYNLALLGGRGLPMATVGHDFAPYGQWLRERSVDLAHVREVEGESIARTADPIMVATHRTLTTDAALAALVTELRLTAREWVDDRTATPGDLETLTVADEAAWNAQRADVLLYR